MLWPFISRKHHEEVASLLQAQITRLLEDLATRDRMLGAGDAERKELTEKLIELATLPAQRTVAPIGVVPRPRREPSAHAPKVLDPDDTKGLVKQAIAETGTRNAGVILRRVEHMRAQLREAQLPRLDAAYHADRPITEANSQQAEALAAIEQALKEGEAAAHQGVA